ncbi:MAG: hypothetical protein WA862_00120 [Solirubrobacterales bacterium]
MAPGERTYQSKVPMVGAAIGTIIFFFIGASCIIAAPSLGQKLGYGSICLLTSAALYRYGQSSLVAMEEGVRVGNPWSHYELRWEQIDRFELGRWRINSAVCLIRQVDDGIKPAVGIAEGNLANGSAQKLIDELNAELAKRTARPISSGPG